MSWKDDDIRKAIVGKKVTKVYVTTDQLLMETTGGPVAFRVEGDCCSHSYFQDLVGVEKLLTNGPVLAVNEIALAGEQYDRQVEEYEDCIQVYGYELVTESPEWGEQTTVVAFRNNSNGYYGGWMEPGDWDGVPPVNGVVVMDSWAAE